MIIKSPEKIPVGVKGWKVREIERLIIEVVSRSTTPQSGWTIRQKFLKSRTNFTPGKELCEIMFSLYQRGFLERTGFDSDRDSVYKIPD